MAHAYKPEEFVVQRQAKQAFEVHKQANPSPNSIAKTLERIKLLEQLLGV